MSWANIKRAARKGAIIDPEIHQFNSDEYSTGCHSNAGLISHRKSPTGRPLSNYDQYNARNNMQYVNPLGSHS